MKYKSITLVAIRYLLIYSFSIILLPNYGLGQNNPIKDAQWLIIDSKGKVGFDNTSGPYNFNIYGNKSISKDFTIIQVSHPSPQIPSASNDIFIIYGDGQYYNSRYLQNSPFKPINASNQNDQNHNMRSTHLGGNIKYFYLTNRYEGDDPPELVRVSDGHSGNNSIPYSFDTTLTAMVMSSNHDITPYSDITIIIDGQSVTPGCSFSFNKVSNLNGRNIRVGDFFEPSYAFNNLTQFCNIPSIIYHPSADSITFPRGSENQPYVFINLKPTSNLPLYYPNNDTLNSKAVFTLHSILGGDAPMTWTYPELILASHDPNYLELKSICKNGEHYYANYHLEFRNDGGDAADHLSATFLAPPHLDPSCIHVSEWNAGGNTQSGSILLHERNVPVIVQDVSGKRISNTKEDLVEFEYPSSSTVLSSLHGPTSGSVGYINFCIRIKERSLQKTLRHSYRLHSPKVYFNSRWEPITDFSNRQFNESLDKDTLLSLPFDIQNCACDCDRFSIIKTKFPKAPKVNIQY